MKKIAYIELDTHAELAANFFELTRDSTEFSVDLYFSEKIYKLLNIHEKNIFIADYSNILEVLENKKYDLIILGTVHRQFLFYRAICERFETGIIIHNLNFAKSSKWQLFKNIFKEDFRYRFKLFLKEGLLEAPEVYEKATYLFGIDEQMSAKNNLKFSPVYFNQFNNKNTDNQAIKIVVPGIVSQTRRDYFSFFEKLRKFKNIGKDYEIVFLGKAGKKELSELKKLGKEIPDFIKIKYFEEKIPQKKFDEIMKNADVLYCPIQPETEFFSVKEIYGETKISGNIGDAIKYGKPAIFPEMYDSDLEFIVKENQDLQGLFSEIGNQRFDFNFYSKENVKNRFSEFVKSL